MQPSHTPASAAKAAAPRPAVLGSASAPAKPAGQVPRPGARPAPVSAGPVGSRVAPSARSSVSAAKPAPAAAGAAPLKARQPGVAHAAPSPKAAGAAAAPARPPLQVETSSQATRHPSPSNAQHASAGARRTPGSGGGEPRISSAGSSRAGAFLSNERRPGCFRSYCGEMRSWAGRR